MQTRIKSLVPAMMEFVNDVKLFVRKFVISHKKEGSMLLSTLQFVFSFSQNIVPLK